MSKRDTGRQPAGPKKKTPRQTGGWSTRKKLLIALGAVVAVILIVAIPRIPARDGDSGPPPGPKTYSAPPPMTIDTAKQYTATIETEKGNLVLELFASDVPMTVNNFVFLARDGFYDGLTFHRVEPGFVIQGGCPIGNGRGGPGYPFNDEITEHSHTKGALSMANSGPNTNGSQFFITLADWESLDGSYSVFGRLVEGMDVLERIERGDVMIRVTIEETNS